MISDDNFEAIVETVTDIGEQNEMAIPCMFCSQLATHRLLTTIFGFSEITYFCANCREKVMENKT